ncbi:hypothetical protein HZS_4747 [Henneguya salminicola]|nr:hypothetical protein HZS_4747 [Henneguya salminicola]
MKLVCKLNGVLAINFGVLSSRIDEKLQDGISTIIRNTLILIFLYQNEIKIEKIYFYCLDDKKAVQRYSFCSPLFNLCRSFGSNKHICYINKTFLYYFDIRKCDHSYSLAAFFKFDHIFCATVKVCIEQCPTYYGPATVENHVCINGTTVTNDEELSKRIEEGKCAPFVLPTFPFFHRCIPNPEIIAENHDVDIVKIDGKTAIDMILKHTKESVFDQIILKDNKRFQNTQMEKYLVIVLFYNNRCLLIPFILSLFFILLMGFGSYYVILLLYLISVAGCTIVIIFLSLFKTMPNLKIFNRTISNKIMNKVIKHSMLESNDFYITSFVILSVVFVFLFLLGCCFGEKLRQACACIKQASISTAFMFLGILPMILWWIIQAGLLIFLIFLIFYLGTTSSKEYRFVVYNDGRLKIGDLCKPEDAIKRNIKECLFTGYYSKKLILAFKVVSGFAIIWTIFLIQAISIFQIAYSHYKYYCTQRIASPLGFLFYFMESLAHAFSFNFGSLIIGSLLITIFLFIKIIFEFISRILGINDNHEKKALSKWAMKILSIIQSIFKRLTSRAYIEIAVTGKSFCNSSKEVIKIFAGYPITSLFIEVLCTLITVIGISGCTIGSGFLTYCYLKELPDIMNPIILSMIYFIYAILPVYSIFKFYTIGIATVHYCVCYDLIINDGTSEKPYLMPKYMADSYKEDKNEFTGNLKV